MHALIDAIESLIHRDVGRGMDAVFAATRGGLLGAARALAAVPAPRIGLITGFFVPGGVVPAAETDGPAASALLARAFTQAGLTVRLATDTICAGACRVALDTVGAGGVPIDAVAPEDGVESVVEAWRRDGIDRVIAVERCGPAADGSARNMRGIDIAAYAAPLDRLFVAGPWRTIAVGDGGNEIGMGNVPRSLIHGHVPFGALIGCTIPAEFLIAAGVSHWGGYALPAALALLRPDWAHAMQTVLDPELDRAVVAAMVRDGPAVDGVTLRREVTIDALVMEVHLGVMAGVRSACGLS